MKKPFQAFLIVSLIYLCFAPNQAAVAENEELNTSVVLYDYKGKFLWDSQWGKITICQRALKEKLNACGKAGIGVDGKFGKNSRDGVIRLSSCPGFENLSVDTNHPLYGTIHSALWKREKDRDVRAESALQISSFVRFDNSAKINQIRCARSF